MTVSAPIYGLTALLTVILCPFAVREAIAASQAAPRIVQDTPYKSTTESPRLYHSDAAETLRGTVVSTETVMPAEGAAPFVQLNLKTGEEIVPVHL